MKKAFIFLSCLIYSLAALENENPANATFADSPMEVASDQCEFDGKKLTLSGSISIVHELGKITAGEAILFPNPEEKKLSIGSIKIAQNVNISSKDGSRLTCEEAILNFLNKHGEFLSGGPTAFVIYQSGLKDKTAVPLVIKSRSMQAQIENAKAKNESQLRLNSVIAREDVEIQYKDVTATADNALFQRIENQIDPDKVMLKEMPGVITLSMSQPEDFCRIYNTKGDLIYTPTLSIDTSKRKIDIQKPKGKVQIQENALGSYLEFSANSLIWDLNTDHLRLKENIVAEIPNRGTLKTDEELEIFYNNVDGKRQLRCVESQGLTVLTSPEKDSVNNHYLYCFGKMLIDHEKLVTTFDSPINQQGQVSTGNQVVFRDSIGEMHADKLFIYYENVEGKMSPSKMIAEGNVYLLDRKGTPANEIAPLLHYALADRAEYEFESKEAHFIAAKKNRVLFYDKTNNLQISAPALKLKRNGPDNKESVQGIGDVRFSFLEKESDRLNERFESLPNRY